MNLQQLRDTYGQRALDDLAFKLGTSPAYLSMIRRGHNRPSPQLAQRMVAIDKRLTLPELRPDIWRDGGTK